MNQAQNTTQGTQPQVQVNVQQPQNQSQSMENGGSATFEGQENMQGDGSVANPNPAEANDASAPQQVMEEGGEVEKTNSSDDLDWGMVFTFFKISNE